MDDYLEDDQLDDYNALLERFRTKWRELDAAGQRVRLYAVLDQAGLTEAERRTLGNPDRPQGVSLYAGSGLESLEAIGPVLLEMPDVRDIKPLTYSSFVDSDSSTDRFLRLLSLAKERAACVTWVWTPHDAHVLVEHLQTLLHARLGTDGEDAWFFFYSPAHLKVLHERLPETTHAYAFGPVHAWWMLDVHGGMVELEGAGSPVPRAWDVLPIPVDVATALQRAAMPTQVYAWLKQARMIPATAQSHNSQMAEIIPMVERAHGYGLGRRADLATFVAYGLRYRMDYDKHPKIAAVLAETISQGAQLASAYRRIEATIWRELTESALQSMQAPMEREQPEEPKGVGQIRLRTSIVNMSGKHLQFLYFLPYGKSRDDRQYIGSVPTQTFDEVVVQKDDLLAPLPGDRLVLSWDDISLLPSGRSYRTPCESQVTVEGEMPRDGDSGVLELRFEKSGQKVVMYRNEDARRNARRSRQ